MNGALPRIDASVVSDRGRVREANEDRVRLVRPADAETLARRGVLVLVADGMGGHLAGEVASDLATATIHRAYYDCPGEVPDALRGAFLEANRLILEQASNDPALQGMGTTCTALVILGWKAHWAHVGDSRLYLARAGRLYQMTEDHSAVARLVAQGLISRADARRHEDRNVILRALGTHMDLEVDVSAHPIDLQDGDRCLLATDGLCDLVDDDDLLRLGGHGPVAEASGQLVELAKARGGHDNITVALVAVEGAGGDERGTGTGEPPETATWRAP